MTRLHLVTDRRLRGVEQLIADVEDGLRGGVTAVQLREKDLEGRALRRLAAELLVLCRRFGAPLLINDRIDVALAVGADGVHLPARSFRIGEARSLLGRGKLVGVSTHTVAEVEAARREGADYAYFGPIFATPSKAEFGAPQGIDELSRATAVAMPVIAIGGVAVERVQMLRDAGAAGVAVITAILAAPSPRSASMALRAAIDA